MGKTRWTSTLDAALKEMTSTKTTREIADTLGVTLGSVRHRMAFLGLVKQEQRTWTAKESRQVIELRKAGAKIAELMQLTGRTRQSIHMHLKSRKALSPNRWTKTETRDLIRMYESGTAQKVMAEWLGKTEKAVECKLRNLRRKRWLSPVSAGGSCTREGN